MGGRGGGEGGLDRVGAWQRWPSSSSLQVPKADAATIVNSRFPVPRYIVCDQHKSQARFLMAKLNPSITQNNEVGPGSSAPIFTDDVSFAVFMVRPARAPGTLPRATLAHAAPPPTPQEHLIKLSTQS